MNFKLKAELFMQMESELGTKFGEAETKPSAGPYVQKIAKTFGPTGCFHEIKPWAKNLLRYAHP